MTASYETTPLSASNHIPLHKGLSDISHRYDGFILDLFGVVHNGIEPYPGVLECLRTLKSSGKKVVLLSNTPKLSSSSKHDLSAMGVTGDLYEHLITAGDAAHTALKNRSDEFHSNCGQKCWFLGQEHIHHVLEGLNLKLVDGPDSAHFILNAMPGTDGSDNHYNDIKDPFQKAIESDLPMVCSNPDLIVHIGDNLHYCAGTYAQLYEEMGGRVAYHGKPYAAVYEMAQESMQISERKRICAMGDSLKTDIQGAFNFGIDSIFNLIGIHRDEVLNDNNTDDIDMEKVMLSINNHPFKPTAVMAGLKW